MKAHLAILTLGVCLVGASLLLSAGAERRDSPGRLVASTATIAWNFPRTL